MIDDVTCWTLRRITGGLGRDFLCMRHGGVLVLLPSTLYQRRRSVIPCSFLRTACAYFFGNLAFLGNRRRPGYKNGLWAYCAGAGRTEGILCVLVYFGNAVGGTNLVPYMVFTSDVRRS